MENEHNTTYYQSGFCWTLFNTWIHHVQYLFMTKWRFLCLFPQWTPCKSLLSVQELILSVNKSLIIMLTENWKSIPIRFTHRTKQSKFVFGTKKMLLLQKNAFDTEKNWSEKIIENQHKSIFRTQFNDNNLFSA